MTSGPDDKPIEVASPACLMHEADASYMGYFDAAELIARLNALLEDAHACARIALAADEAKTGAVAEQSRTVHGDETRFCAMLKEHIERLGGVPSDKIGALYEQAMAISEPDERIESLARARLRLVQILTEIIPRVRDDRLRSDLARQLSTQSAAMISES